MHELALAEQMLRVMLQSAGAARARRVLRARLRIGALSCIEPETLRGAFEFVARSTPAGECELHFVRVPVRVLCGACGILRPGLPFDPCPSCGATGGEVVEGRETFIESIDVDAPGDPPGGGSER
ncbi:MAG: hydrogenase maturation nickel metallochaperone HypA [Planctomycetes bacterium]|nr:hydrogenase maturation nickel metallochaperone HypA [Planctomycetota bacterium]